MRRILHIDMDAFFATVEQKRHPELIGKPVVVGGAGNPNQRGVVSTASYEARKFGIHSAMPLRTAYRLCPAAVFLPVDYEEYSRVSEKMRALFLDMDTLQKEEYILEKGDKIRMKPRCGHIFYGLEDTLVVEYSPQVYDMEDSNRIDLGV